MQTIDGDDQPFWSPTRLLVRTGAMGEVWSCVNGLGIQIPRTTRVVCRTARGIELGEVLVAVEDHLELPSPSVGELVRLASVEDELLDSRLRRYKKRAVQDCQREIASLGLPATLLEIDHLHDGRTLIFYFLGEINASLRQLTERLVETYETKVRSRHFAKLLSEGCGPGCGTDAGQGCGSQGGCAVCVLAAACAKPT
jgi:hypothetical protein